MAHDWFYKVGEQLCGPVSASELLQKAATGEILPNTPVSNRPDGRWVRAEQVQGLFRRADSPPLPENRDSHRESPTQASPLPENPTSQSEGQCGVPRKTHGANLAYASTAASVVALLLLIAPLSVAASPVAIGVAIPVAIGAIILGLMGIKSERRGWACIGIICGGVIVLLVPIVTLLFEMRNYDFDFKSAPPPSPAGRTQSPGAGVQLSQPPLMAVEISVGTTRLSIPSPDGYSPITSDMQPYAELAKRFVSPSNEQFALFLPEAAAAAAARGEIPQPQRLFFVQTAKAFIQPFVSTADFAQVKRTIKTQNEDILKKVESQIPGHFQKVSKGISADYNVDFSLSLDQMLPLPPHYETERGLAYSTLLKYKVNDEEGKPSVFEGVVTATLVHLQGKVLFLYVNAEKSRLDWCRSESAKWADAVIAANPSTGDIAARERMPFLTGLDWSKAFAKAIGAAIIGGIAAGLMIVFRKRRANQGAAANVRPAYGLCAPPSRPAHAAELGRWESSMFGLLRFFRGVCGFVFALQVIHVIEAATRLLEPEAVVVDMGGFFALLLIKVVFLGASGLMFFWLRSVINRLHIRKHGVPHPALAKKEWAL